jgi:hypothetical protein
VNWITESHPSGKKIGLIVVAITSCSLSGRPFVALDGFA